MMTLRCLGFCFTIWAVSLAQDLVVTQPISAQGTEGGSVVLPCSYHTTSKPKVGSYQWVKDPGLAVKKSTPEFMGRVNCTSDQHFLLDRRADLEIRDLRHYDSGIYRCVVNIHGLQEASGNGTELQVVKAAVAPKDNEEGVLWLMELGAGLGSVLAASAAVSLIILCCRRKRGRRARGARAKGPSQDPEAKAEATSVPDLNYVELTVIKKGTRIQTERETITYASVEKHGKDALSDHSG
ncbi:uncharacterized protein LOC143834402 [Paroedura picta]|uniref:uncharacterized protein LOC143834402 n=1 Tax=Paroedura picta TaxID=143630 RepID=UPI004056FB16